jgi:hypothetical protein
VQTQLLPLLAAMTERAEVIAALAARSPDPAGARA